MNVVTISSLCSIRMAHYVHCCIHSGEKYSIISKCHRPLCPEDRAPLIGDLNNDIIHDIFTYR